MSLSSSLAFNKAMKILRLTFIFFVFLISNFLLPPLSLAASPTDDYHLNSFFPLLKFIPPPQLKVYEQKDRSRLYDDSEIKVLSEVDVCQTNSDCIAQFQRCTGSVCGKVETENGRCQKSDPDLPGSCNYVQNPSCNAALGGSDYARPDNLAFPKIQNEWQRYDYIGSDNPISFGTHNLALSVCDRAELQLITLTQAAQTKETVDATREWPLGWVDWEYQTRSGQTLLEVWENLGSLQGIGIKLTAARDELLLSKGNTIVDTTSAKQELCQKVTDKTLSKDVQALLSSPIYPPSTAKGYARCSICVNSSCRSSKLAEGLYTDLSVRPALSAAITDLFLTYPLETALSTLKKAIVSNPLLPFTQVATREAIPSVIQNTLTPTVAGLPTPFTLSALGDIYDYQEKMSQFKYRLMDTPETIAGGSVPSTLTQNILNLVYGVVSLFVDLNTHLIVIPEPMAQSIVDLQTPVYQTRDSVADQKNDSYSKVSSLIDSSSPIAFGKGMGPAESRRRMAWLSCSDPDYSAPEETIIADYALGTRIGCSQASAAVPEGKCDGALFAKLIAGSPYQNIGDSGNTYFETFIKGNLTPELMNTYAAAEERTGVPCEILAGIHAVESGNNPTGSLVSGRTLGTSEPDAGGKVFSALLDTAIYAGEHLKGKVGGNIKDAKTAITALSRYNGGGNSNCQLGYPYPIPYGGCPKLFEGEDDPYATSYLDSRHDAMYLLYCADHTACAPQLFGRPGAFTVALAVYNSLTKGGYENSALPQTQEKPAPAGVGIPRSGSAPTTGIAQGSCGEGELSTALGCLPYTREAFVSALLSFIIGVAGGIALIIMLIATFQIMTAGGNPEQLQKGKELFTGAIIGLLFLIFSVSLLRIFAGSIIKLPGF